MSKEALTPLAEEVARAKIAALDAQALKYNTDAAVRSIELTRLKRYDSEEQASAWNNRIYTFWGGVDSTACYKAINDLGVWSRNHPGQDITIVFNSPGGSVIAGLALYDYIKELQAAGHKITTVALGWAASMGGVLLQAGDVRVIGRNAYLLIHEVSSMGMGKVSEMEDELKFTKRLQSRLLDILSERSSMTKTQIKRKWVKTDWWLDSDECLDLGFVDAIRTDPVTRP